MTAWYWMRQETTSFWGRARRVYLQPGASWHELRAGTNAIGTSIIERRFVRVVGKQHFLEENQFLVCNAAPILSPTGDLAGVLDLSGGLAETFAPADQLVRSAVAHIEHDWVAESAEYDLLVRLHPHPSWVGTPEEGMLGFRDDLLVVASARALSMLGLRCSAIRTACWDDIFSERPLAGLQQLRLQGRPGQYFGSISRRSPHVAHLLMALADDNAVLTAEPLPPGDFAEPGRGAASAGGYQTESTASGGHQRGRQRQRSGASAWRPSQYVIPAHETCGSGGEEEGIGGSSPKSLSIRLSGWNTLYFAHVKN